MSERAVITGIGSICSLGVGADALFGALRDGATSFAKRSFPAADPWPEQASLFTASIGTVPVEALLGKKGLRTLNRESRIALSAAALATRHAGVDLAAVAPEKLGVFIATQFAGLDDYTALVADGIQFGADQVNPMLGPQSGFNAPASQMAIRLNAQGPNITMTSGAPSSLDLIDHASDFLIDDPQLSLLAGGLDLVSFFSARALREWCGTDQPPSPYDTSRTGPVCGEAGVIFLLESKSAALDRGATLHAELLGAGNNHGSPTDVIDQALDQAGITAGDVCAIMASANGDRELDAAEAAAIHHRFGDKTPVYAVKGATGECFGAGGALQLAAGLYCLATGSVPGTAGLKDFDPELAPIQVSSVSQPVEPGPLLVVSLDPRGNASALVIAPA